MRTLPPLLLVTLFLLTFVVPASGAETVRVATYNVENYLLMNRVIDGRWRPSYPKPEAEKTALRAVIAAVNPDILAMQEIGAKPFLLELQRDLEADGIYYPHAELLEMEGEVRFVAVLSRLPVKKVNLHTDRDFLYFGVREKIKRGMLELVFETGGETWSLFVLHLKSKWTERADDPLAARRRLGEATAARDTILSRHNPEAGALFIIAGDLNDTADTATLRRFLRRGPVTISQLIPATDSRGHAWTQRWERQDLYSRIDYLLPSPAMMDKLVDARGHVYDGPGYAIASDHRLVWADFRFETDPERAGEARGLAGQRLGELLRRFKAP